MSARHGVGPALAGVALALLGLPFAASAALAHDGLLDASPADGEVVTSLDAVVLTFSGDALGAQGANLVEVVGPDGRHYENACPILEGPEVRTPVALGSAGAYEVTWRIVSSDGHPVSGRYSFDYAPEGSATPAEGSAAPACAPPGAAAPVSTAPTPPDTGASAAPAETGSSAVPGVWLGVGIGAAVTVAVAVGAWLLIRRPSPGEASEEDDRADD